jgi:hypothetical protein
MRYARREGGRSIGFLPQLGKEESQAMRKIGVVLASAALALGALFVGSYAGPVGSVRQVRALSVPARPNIVFILTDDMRKDDLPDIYALSREPEGTGNPRSQLPHRRPGKMREMRMITLDEVQREMILSNTRRQIRVRDAHRRFYEKAHFVKGQRGGLRETIHRPKSPPLVCTRRRTGNSAKRMANRPGNSG